MVPKILSRGPQNELVRMHTFAGGRWPRFHYSSPRPHCCSSASDSTGYSVVQRRREIGLRLALGAQAGHIVRGLTNEIVSMLVLGTMAGFQRGTLERYSTRSR